MPELDARQRRWRLLALASPAWQIHGGLYPFGGWRAPAVPFAFLAPAWPEHWRRADILINVLAYLPVGLLLVDLKLFAPNRTPTFREGAYWSIGWLVLALLIAPLVWVLSSADDAITYTTIYFVERSLSLDNLFVTYGGDVKIVEYPRARHDFDFAELPESITSPNGTVGSNPQAAVAAWDEVLRFLKVAM